MDCISRAKNSACNCSFVLLQTPTAVSTQKEITMSESGKTETDMDLGLIGLKMEAGTMDCTKMVRDMAKAITTGRMAGLIIENSKTELKSNNWNNWCFYTLFNEVNSIFKFCLLHLFHFVKVNLH